MKKKINFDLNSLEAAAARVRAKLEDFDEKWVDAHKDELNKGGFFNNPDLVNRYFVELDEYLYKKNNKNESK